MSMSNYPNALPMIVILTAIFLPPLLTQTPPPCTPTNCQDIGCYKYPHGEGVESHNVTEYTATGKVDKNLQCEFTDNGTWTELMRRGDTSSSVNFNQSWNKYREGFGDPGGDHWLGLRYASEQLGNDKHTLRVDLATKTGVKAHAVFYGFTLFETSTGDGYKIRYELIAPGSNAGNGLCTNCEFHTTDHDTTKDKCAESHYQSAGFFHRENTCLYAANLLLGRYRVPGSSNVKANEMYWSTFKYLDANDPLVFATMKFRPGADPSDPYVCKNPCGVDSACEYSGTTKSSSCSLPPTTTTSTTATTTTTTTTTATTTATTPTTPTTADATTATETGTIGSTTNQDSVIEACPCVNGGSCKLNGHTTECVCPDGFTGRLCDDKEGMSVVVAGFIGTMIFLLLIGLCFIAIRPVLRKMNEEQAVRDEAMRRPESERLIDYSGVITEMVHQAEEEEKSSRTHSSSTAKVGRHTIFDAFKQKATWYNPMNIASARRKSHK